MKITAVNTYVLKSPLQTPFAFSQGWVRQRAAAIVEVVTDAGISGWGEALCVGMQPPEIAAATVESALAPVLLGADPREPEVLWHAMYNRTRDFGQKGAVISGISAVDIALWDLCGKARGEPVWRLLGGAFRRRVRAYATGFYRIQGQGEAARLAEEAVRHHESGLSLMKVKLGFGIADDLAVMAAIDRALQGRSVTLMIDTNHAYGEADAIRLGRALEPLSLRWYEEPVAPENIEGYCNVRRALAIPIAGGECDYTAFGFGRLAAARALDIAQPDIAAAGGFTACRHIAAICLAHGIQVNPHVWGAAIAQRASLHLIASLPLAHPSLFATEPILEYDSSDHPFRTALVDHPVQQKDGWVEIDDRPGLGIEVDRDALMALRA
ncbi:MAG: mandelate racemase/muconate lactonizing enzyme family protein [Betaproteobacteria bacterium]|nr:mandelate racemase/muconate lactonizing enzyme family protein [Betaproteobacteria bacterium]MBK9607959.1 mandelate racemase/muconate lactonizing enzyme family protein [Betaproteobacteria bacterium]